MIGAIAGDIIGSPYEASPIKTKDFPLFSSESRFTDDTVLTCAVASWIMQGAGIRILGLTFEDFYRCYQVGYGPMFSRWVEGGRLSFGESYGNGSAMRVSPVSWLCSDLNSAIVEASYQASVTHGHPEGRKGAEAVSAAIFMARRGYTKEVIRSTIEKLFSYDLSRSIGDIRPTYKFDATCQGSVPESIICFLESDSWEDAVRNAVSLGGDADTMACIAGSIAEAFYGVPPEIRAVAMSLLDDRLRGIVTEFEKRYGPPSPS